MLFQIELKQVNLNMVQTINARELHGFLNVGRDFSTWIKNRINEYGFVENQDFIIVQNLSSPKWGSSKSRQQVMIEYHITLDMAKELSMLERNDQGKTARKYFIECEKMAKALPQDYPSALRALAEQHERLQQERDFAFTIKIKHIGNVERKAPYYKFQRWFYLACDELYGSVNSYPKTANG